jgi:hypothetical protein
VRTPFRSPDRLLSLHWPWTSAQGYWDAVQRHVESLDHPYLAFAIRSSDPEVPELRRTRATLDHLLGHPLVQRLRFSDPVSELPGLGCGYALQG